jgi:lipopolysaccharide exporter
MHNLSATSLPTRALPLLKGMAAFGAAELSVRIVRLITVIIIARQLAPEIVGVAALTLTLFELVRVLANIGIGQRIIAAGAADLDALCNAAARLFWIWCCAVAVFQISLAAILAYGFGQSVAAQMLAVLALVYLCMPGGLVQCYLLMREGRASITARNAAIQTIADHLLTAALLLLWPSPWSIVLPKLLTAPIWLILTRRARPWFANPTAGYAPVKGLMRFGISVLATDMLMALRGQLDKLIISATLGLNALGTYYFAYNAGIGIVSSLITAFGTVAFPWLCASPEGQERAKKLKLVLGLGALLFIPLILAQALLAPYYVPVIFGPSWSHAAPLVAILCLAGIPMLFSNITTLWLRTKGQVGLDASAGLFACLCALGGLFIGTQTRSVETAATYWLAGLSLGVLPFAAFVLRRGLHTPIAPNLKEIVA